MKKSVNQENWAFVIMIAIIVISFASCTVITNKDNNDYYINKERNQIEQQKIDIEKHKLGIE